MVEGMGRMKQPVWKVLLIVPCYFIADALHLSYGGNGILLMALFALTRELPGGKWIQAVGMVLINGIMPSANIRIFGLSVSVQLFGALAMVPIALYSGQKRTRSKAISWGFTSFTPCTCWPCTDFSCAFLKAPIFQSPAMSRLGFLFCDFRR